MRKVYFSTAIKQNTKLFNTLFLTFKMQVKNNLKKIWHFLWHDNSLLSWVAFVLVATILIKFVFYPLIGLIFQTSLPIVAVVSSSMDHNGNFDSWWNSQAVCGKEFCDYNLIYYRNIIPKEIFKPNMNKAEMLLTYTEKAEFGDFIVFFDKNKDIVCKKEICNQNLFYFSYNISKENFREFRFKNGFNKGDMLVLTGIKPKNIQIGDVVVYDGNYKGPIIHRVTGKFIENNKYYFIFKGDNNQDRDPVNVDENKIIGKAVLIVPYAGWVKVIFTDMINKIISIWR